MKKFNEGDITFAFTTYKISAAPILSADRDTSGALAPLAKAICQSACFLSAEGNGQTSIEILRIAGKQAGGRIEHLLTIRSYSASEQDCVIRQQALEKTIFELIRRSGFIAAEVSFEDYKKHIGTIEKAPVCWSLQKEDIHHYGVRGNYQAPSYVEAVDWKSIYAFLDSTGAALYIQITPALLTDNERRLIAKMQLIV